LAATAFISIGERMWVTPAASRRASIAQDSLGRIIWCGRNVTGEIVSLRGRPSGRGIAI